MGIGHGGENGGPFFQKKIDRITLANRAVSSSVINELTRP